MKRHNVPSALALSRAIGGRYGEIMELINMTMSPLNTNPKKAGELWKTVVIQLADFFKVLPEQMFNQQQLYSPLETNSAEKEIEEAALLSLMPCMRQELIGPDEEIDNNRKEAIVNKTLESFLTPREITVINQRFGLNGLEAMTYEEMGKANGVTRDRVRQIEQKALRKMRQPSRGNKLKNALGLDSDAEEVNHVSYALTDKHKEILDNCDNEYNAIDKYSMHKDSALKYVKEVTDNKNAKRLAEATAKEQLIIDTIYDFAKSFGYMTVDISMVPRRYSSQTITQYRLKCVGKDKYGSTVIENLLIDFSQNPEFADRKNLTKEMILAALKSGKVLYIEN